jgi:hypothetical protein
MEESRAAAGGAQAGVAVAFSLKPEGRDALTALSKGEKTWVSLAVNTDDETIEFVDGFAELAADQWPSKLPDDKPLYIFINTGGSLAMVYFCPDTAPIKQKMLGSTVKASAQAQAARREQANYRMALLALLLLPLPLPLPLLLLLLLLLLCSCCSASA